MASYLGVVSHAGLRFRIPNLFTPFCILRRHRRIRLDNAGGGSYHLLQILCFCHSRLDYCRNGSTEAPLRHSKPGNQHGHLPVCHNNWIWVLPSIHGKQGGSIRILFRSLCFGNNCSVCFSDPTLPGQNKEYTHCFKEMIFFYRSIFTDSRNLFNRR